nr:VOC family protein [Paenibacillus bovis]
MSSQQNDIKLAPWLSVSNGAEALQFYKKAFHVEEIYRLDDNGTLIIAHVKVGGAEFWIQEDPESNTPARMIMTVSDPDSLFDQALKAGATEVVPVNESHGWRVGRLVDPFGHHWEIGRQL